MNAATADAGDRLRAIAEHILAMPLISIEPSGAGANSNVYRIETASGIHALKHYPARAGDMRRRAANEWNALRFLRAHGLDAAPAPLARDPQGQVLIMEWIDGCAVDAPDQRDIDDICRFVAGIFSLSEAQGAAAFPPASEACLSIAEITRQIDKRLEGFAAIPRLDAFLAGAFAERYREARSALPLDGAAQTELPVPLRRLIPADFGFHNALREKDGRLRYIDFDYFGWDDPVKFAADFILHPAMDLPDPLASRFLARIAGTLKDDRDFSERLGQRLPLYALRWALILLNPFRKDRLAAGEYGDGRITALLDERIARAAALLSAPQARGAIPM